MSRAKSAEMACTHTVETQAPGASRSTSDRVIDALDRALDGNVSPADRLADLYRSGVLDSLAIVEATLEIEEAFEIDIDDADIAAFEANGDATVADVIAYVTRRVAS